MQLRIFKCFADKDISFETYYHKLRNILLKLKQVSKYDMQIQQTLKPRQRAFRNIYRNITKQCFETQKLGFETSYIKLDFFKHLNIRAKMLFMHVSKYENLFQNMSFTNKIFHSKICFPSNTFSHIPKNMIQHLYIFFS